MSDLFMMIYMGNSATPESFGLAKRVKSSRSLGCASLEMVLVAEGEADGFMMHVEKYTRGIRVVDIAASTLILREAGGEVYDLDGNALEMEFDIGCRSSFIAFGEKRVYDFIIMEKEITAPVYGICVNKKVPEAKEYTERVLKALEGCDCVIDESIAGELGLKGCPVEDMKVDIMITIGGDGTILRTLMKNKAPLFSINAGGVGFLAEVDAKDIEEGIRRLRSGDYVVEERFKISSWYEGEYLSEAVNEAVVHTDSIAKIRHFKVYVNDRFMMELRADGIMISTPTGSTCYAMSLGAPLIDPRVNAVVVVPMAAYKYASRPFVVPADAKITVETIMDSGCLLVVDGQEEYEIRGKTRIDFIRSPETVKFIRFSTDFYARVRDKLVNAS
jgi:NAD+ kinase